MQIDKRYEDNVIGCLIGDRDTAVVVMEILDVDDFNTAENRTLFSACVNLFNSGRDIDVSTIAGELQKLGNFKATSYESISKKVSLVPTFANAKQYAGLVKETSNKRKLLNMAKAVMANINKSSGSQLLEMARDELYEIHKGIDTGNTKDAETAITENIQKVNYLEKNKEYRYGIETGFYKFDVMTSGLRKGDLMILAARPSVGKSALAVNIMINMLEKEKIPMLFSLEMSTMQVTDRMLAVASGLNVSSIKVGKLNDLERTRYTLASTMLGDSKWLVNDSADITMGSIRAEAMKQKMKYGLDLLMVDYLQLINPGQSRDNRQNQISQISRGLKILAKDLEIPVIALSQLSRAGEYGSEQPKLIHLRDSGAIEQDADIVAFIHRYFQDEAMRYKLIVAKNRNGSIGEMQISFNMNTTKFTGEE